MDFDIARLVLEALAREGVRYAVFGAVAVNLHGLARSTEDLDLFVAPERENVQYVPSDGPFHVDILTRLGEAFRWDDLEVERVPFEGLMVSFVTPRTLYRMKRDTVRAKDKGDAEALRARFKLGDV